MKKIINLVLGSNYGDEGKGQTCYNLAKQHKSCLTVLTNGGCQRGHTVVNDNGLRHVFQHFGSATRSDKDINYYSKNFILNPIMFRQEYETLVRKGIITDEYNNIWYNDNCIYSTPFDMMANQIFELERGDKRHGSTGLGIFATIERYRNMHSFDLLDIHDCTANNFSNHTDDKKWFEDYLYKVRTYYLNLFKKKGIKLEATDYYQSFMSRFLIEHFMSDCAFMLSKTHCDDGAGNRLWNYNFKTDSIIYENGQGLRLGSLSTDVHTTPSYTGIYLTINELSNNHNADIELHIYYVTRPYITRHGAGPVNSKELIGFTSDDKTNIPNPWQGSIRYYELDINDLKKWVIKSYSSCIDYLSADFNCIPHLVITHNDEMDRSNEFKEAFKDVGWDLIFDRNNQ